MIDPSEIMLSNDLNVQLDRRLLDQSEIERLAALDPMIYEREREPAAERLGVRVSVLDEEVKRKCKINTPGGQGNPLFFAETKPWPEPVDGAELLNALRDTVRRFVVCSREIAIAAALWSAFTWLIDRVQVAPLAIVTAPEKRCGKSQLLHLIGRLSCRPLTASNISSSVMFRVIEAHSPTLLIDEADSFMRENEELRGVINSGHTRQSAFVFRNVGDNHEPKQFSTWGAKALACIGRLSETIMDRGIVFELRRKLPNEKVERLRHAEAGLFGRLSSQLARFARDAGSTIECARPELPEALNDRAQDNWEPLLAIADYAGGEWPQLARIAALKLSGAEQEPQSLSTELLADIRDIFDQKGVDRIGSTDLLHALTADESKPWATSNRGKPMTPHQLAKRLGEHGIKPRSVRIGLTTPKGFERQWFADVFARYLPSACATPQQEGEKPIVSVVLPVADDPRRYHADNQSATLKPAEMLGCGVVADKSGGIVEVTI